MVQFFAVGFLCFLADFSVYSEIVVIFCKFIKKIFAGLLTRLWGLLKIVRAFDFCWER